MLSYLNLHMKLIYNINKHYRDRPGETIQFAEFGI